MKQPYNGVLRLTDWSVSFRLGAGWVKRSWSVAGLAPSVAFIFHGIDQERGAANVTTTTLRLFGKRGAWETATCGQVTESRSRKFSEKPATQQQQTLVHGEEHAGYIPSPASQFDYIHGLWDNDYGQLLSEGHRLTIKEDIRVRSYDTVVYTEQRSVRG